MNILHLAITQRLSHLVEKLLDLGVDPNCKTSWGEKPLQFASAQDNLEYIINLLLKNGADIEDLGTERYTVNDWCCGNF